MDVGSIDRRRRAIDLGRSKNGDARTVRLNVDAIAAIESIHRTAQKRTDRMFPRRDNKNPQDRKQQRYDNRSWFEAAVTEAEIPRLTWHELRHTFCSWLAMAGASTVRDHGGCRPQARVPGGSLLPSLPAAHAVGGGRHQRHSSKRPHF